MSKDKLTEDQELQSYLDGGDAVSETYGKLADEQPPEALDRHILAQAHAATGQKADSGPAHSTSSFLAPRYGIAASVFTIFLVGALFYTRQELQTGMDESTSAMPPFTPGSVSVQVAEESVSSSELADADADADAQQATFTASSEVSRAAAPQEARLRTPASGSDQVAAEPETIVVTGARVRQRAESQAGIAETTQADAAPESLKLEDMTISSEDNTNFNQAVLGQEFRLEAETWAEEIFYLRKEAQDANALVEDETERFRQRFPQTDLEALVERFEEAAGE